MKIKTIIKGSSKIIISLIAIGVIITLILIFSYKSQKNPKITLYFVFNYNSKLYFSTGFYLIGKFRGELFSNSGLIN